MKLALAGTATVLVLGLLWHAGPQRHAAAAPAPALVVAQSESSPARGDEQRRYDQMRHLYAEALQHYQEDAAARAAWPFGGMPSAATPPKGWLKAFERCTRDWGDEQRERNAVALGAGQINPDLLRRNVEVDCLLALQEQYRLDGDD